MERNDRLSLPWNKLNRRGPAGQFSLLSMSSHGEQTSRLNKGIHMIVKRFARFPKQFFLFIKNEKFNKLNWQGSNGRLCSLLERIRHRQQSSRSEKGKHIILKRFLRRAKIFLFLKNEQQDKRQFSDDNNLQMNSNRYINWIVKLQIEFSKNSIGGQNIDDTEDRYMEESSRSKKASVKWRDVPGADRYSKLETQKLVCPNLSSINSTNFRVRLYHQLNVVGRRSKLPSHLYLSPSNSSSQGGSGYKGKIHQEFERSKPIAMNKGRIIDYDDGCCDREWPVGLASRLDNDDIFALDM